MDELKALLSSPLTSILRELYQVEAPIIELQQTRKEFEGDITLVVFPYVRMSRKSPEQTAQQIGDALKTQVEAVVDFNVVKGFLNISIANDYWLLELEKANKNPTFGYKPQESESVMVEYSSPNTNKPLHLGHIRNNLLGFSVAELLKASGKKVIKVQIINDRGIHICKSMVAWQKFGNEETPLSSGLKGDKLVGKYYVAFDKAYKEEIEALVQSGVDEAVAKNKAPIMLEARAMLNQWEKGDEAVVSLWKKMNGWVYEGFDITYKRLGVNFDFNYYESDTYILGKKVVEEGLSRNIFYKEADGSVWIDLTEEGLDKKILLRSDGTSVYMTQDIGTAIQRFVDFKEQNLNSLIYTVGNEQDYHFKVLFIILDKLGYDWAKNLYHLSYGMVDLPSGKMKSREGTVVDADDLIDEMISTSKSISEDLGKTEGMSEEEKESLYQMVGLGALKYFMLKVDPKKRMLFNPEESVDFQGNTGPFIQYTHARIKSLLRKGAPQRVENFNYTELQAIEKEVLKQLVQFPEIVQQAAQELSPSVVANYIYELVKMYNSLYQQLPILIDEDKDAIAFRLQLSENVAKVIKQGMHLLGIEVPEQM